MTLAEKQQLYREKFPLCGLGERMADQCIIDDYVVGSNTPKHFLITVFNSWDRTSEGHHFWKDIRELYRQYLNPTRQEIMEVFKRYGIDMKA